MDKLAAIKMAEVQGVLAALVDAELVKVASEEYFNKLAEVVIENLTDDYDLNEVLEKTAAIIEAVNAEDAEPMEKEAEELDEVGQALRYHHELVLKKEAGEVSEDEFRKEAGRVMDAVRKTKPVTKATKFINENLHEHTQEQLKKNLKRVGIGTGAVGGTAVAATGAKKLYDKKKKD